LMDVGVIGLGGMGAGMATALLRAGHRVTVWNRSPEKAEALVAKGAIRAATPAECFAGEAAFSMLADDRAVREAIVDHGLIERAPADFIHLSASTISVDLAQELEALHARAGSGFLSVPVFGRPAVAEAGQLNVLVAGAPARIERAKPLLEAIGKAVWPVGEEPHKANVVKLAINFTLACAIEAMGEAFALARRWDIEPKLVADVMTGSLFEAPAYKVYAPIILNEAFDEPAFRLRLGLKDVREALKAAEAKAVPMPFASVVRDSLLEAMAHGWGEKDFAALGAVPSRRAGI
jgi:3-hydroxyisobutyrate dehydrogenase-like beta-hydroxyacid dehydrogenase